MTTALTMFGDNAQLPAHLQALQEQENIVTRDSTPILSLKGKTWRMRIDGEETILTRTNADGESEPVPQVKVVVLNVNPNRSRTFYAGAYDSSKNASPDCWSSDGTRPDKDVKQPVAATCASCPNSVKGSKVNDAGKETTACSVLKRIAVIPAVRPEMTAMLLKIPQTSIWDKNNAENEAKGWFAWDQYIDFLRQRGLKHTAGVVTKIKFDPNVEYPKLLFSAERWLTAEETTSVVPLVNSEAVTKLLSGRIDEGGAEAPEHPVAPATASTESKPAPTAPAPEPAAPAAPAVSDEDDEDAFASAAPVAPAAPKPAAKPKAAKAAPASVAQPAPVVTGTPTDLAALASQWDD